MLALFTPRANVFLTTKQNTYFVAFLSNVTLSSHQKPLRIPCIVLFIYTYTYRWSLPREFPTHLVNRLCHCNAHFHFSVKMFILRPRDPKLCVKHQFMFSQAKRGLPNIQNKHASTAIQLLSTHVRTRILSKVDTMIQRYMYC